MTQIVGKGDRARFRWIAVIRDAFVIMGRGGAAGKKML
jgi:hypothetical protein